MSEQQLRHGLALTIAGLSVLAALLGDNGWAVLAAATALLVIAEDA